MSCGIPTFTDIRIEPSADFRQCQASDHMPLVCGRYGVAAVRCGGDGDWIVHRTSVLTGRRYASHMCGRHAEPWRC